jgi:SAM-dependent methyltransferase
VIAALRRRVLRHRRVLSVAQFAVTGERMPRRLPLLADAIRDGQHTFVVDLGCGSAPLLDYVAPGRYVGIESSEIALGEARRRHAGPGRTFVLADLRDVPLATWRGADVAVVSSVTHHLDDNAVVTFTRRVRDELAPGRFLLQDAEPTGILAPFVRAADDGRHLRPRQDLLDLLAQDSRVKMLWAYDNPLRSFRQFLLELEPRE